MSKITLASLANLQNETTAVSTINSNSSIVQTAMDNTLSRDGTSPNQMGSPIDMNSNQILNLPAPISGQSPLRLTDYNTLLSGGTIFVSNVIGLEFIIDGGAGGVLTVGPHGYLQVPFNCLINQVNLLADQTGSVVVDIWKSSFANFNPPSHPAIGDSITGSSKPTITAGTSYQDTVLSGWTTGITAGDVLGYTINSASVIQRLTISLKVTKQ